MKRRIYWFVLFVVTGIVAVSPVLAQASDLENISERYVEKFVAAVNTGDRAEFEKFISASYGEKMLALKMEENLAFFSWLHDNSRGLVVHSILEQKPDRITALLQDRLVGGWHKLRIHIEQEAPHRIAGLRVQPGSSPDPVERQLNDKQVARELRSFMQKLADADVFSGAVLLARDGRVVFQGAYGMANKDFNAPNRIDTKFNLGSMNKMFTGLAIMQLVETGRLSLDDPLSKFVPDFPDKNSARKISIKHLVTHTSGLGSYFGQRFFESSKTLFVTVDDWIKFAAPDEKLLFEPGTKWQYSNTGYVLLGKVIEEVTGKSYDDYVRENIMKPATMHQTDTYSLDQVNRNLAVGYDKQFAGDGIRFKNNLFLHVIRGGPAGGGYSTVEDLLKFDRALRSNKLLKAETLAAMLAPKPELGSAKYGYGFSVNTKLSIVGHNGGFPGISSQLDIFLESGWTAVVMSNYTDAAWPVAGKMRELVAASK